MLSVREIITVDLRGRKSLRFREMGIGTSLSEHSQSIAKKYDRVNITPLNVD